MTSKDIVCVEWRYQNDKLHIKATPLRTDISNKCIAQFFPSQINIFRAVSVFNKMLNFMVEYLSHFVGFLICASCRRFYVFLKRGEL